MSVCYVGHQFDETELRRTRRRLPCGCPLTVMVARVAEGIDEEHARELLRRERNERLSRWRFSLT